ncbi:MAG: hypothetical protein V1769_06175 [Thermoplasmatota archaeon]
MWQDLILTIINFGFILTILPAIAVNYRRKDTKGQSIITYASTSVLLTIMSFIFITLDLVLSAASTAGTAATWYILSYQKIHYSQKKHISSEEP